MLPVPEKNGPVTFFSYAKSKGVLRQMIVDAANNPALIRQAILMIRRVDGGSYTDEAKCLFEYVQKAIRYTSDVAGQDVYRDPLLTMDLKAGDCNNKVVLGCSLAKAVGFPTRMVFVFEGNPGRADLEAGAFPFHVYYQVDVTKAETKVPMWINCETIPVPEGRSAPGPSRYLNFGECMNVGFLEFVEVER